MRHREVVTCFLRNRRRVLVLKRSPSVRTFRGKWAAVSGGIEEDTPLLQAYREIREEAGLTQDEVCLICQGSLLNVADPENDVLWTVHPFLFEVQSPSRIRLDWEHTEAKWVHPDELDGLDAVPSLKEAWKRLWIE